LPAPDLTALPQTPYLDLRGPTSNCSEGRKDGRKGQGRGEERVGESEKG